MCVVFVARLINIDKYRCNILNAIFLLLRARCFREGQLESVKFSFSLAFYWFVRSPPPRKCIVSIRCTRHVIKYIFELFVVSPSKRNAFCLLRTRYRILVSCTIMFWWHRKQKSLYSSELYVSFFSDQKSYAIIKNAKKGVNDKISWKR